MTVGGNCFLKKWFEQVKLFRKRITKDIATVFFEGKFFSYYREIAHRLWMGNLP